MRRLRGVTLVELMVSLAVLGVLATLTAPSFRQTIHNYRLDNYGNSLVAAARVARSEAIKRNSSVRLCPSANGSTCTTDGQWEQGWIILHGTTQIQKHGPLASDYQFRGATTVAQIDFDASGFGATTAILKVSRPGATGDLRMGCFSISATAIPSYTRKATAAAC